MRLFMKCERQNNVWRKRNNLVNKRKTKRERGKMTNEEGKEQPIYHDHHDFEVLGLSPVP